MWGLLRCVLLVLLRLRLASSTHDQSEVFDPRPHPFGSLACWDGTKCVIARRMWSLGVTRPFEAGITPHSTPAARKQVRDVGRRYSDDRCPAQL